MDKKIGFMLLSRHSDAELSDFIQREEDNGWQLLANRGNLFYFRKSDKRRRVAVYSFLSRSPESSTESELRKELPYLRKSGWDMIAISGPEDIADSRRHAFLYEEIPGSVPPVAEDIALGKAQRRKKHKIISNIVLDLLYILFIAFLFIADFARLSSDNVYLILSLTISLLFICSSVLSVKALISYMKSKKDESGEIKRRGYRNLDRSTLLTFLTLLLILVFLIADFLWSGQTDRGTKTNINGEIITIYSDKVPISLDELGFSSDYSFRSSRHYETDSFLASYSYSYDQYFGSSASNGSFISYSAYSSEYGFLRAIVANELLRGISGRADQEFASAIGADTVIRTRDNCRIFIEKGKSVVFIRSLIPVDAEYANMIVSSII